MGLLAVLSGAIANWCQVLKVIFGCIVHFEMRARMFVTLRTGLLGLDECIVVKSSKVPHQKINEQNEGVIQLLSGQII